MSAFAFSRRFYDMHPMVGRIIIMRGVRDERLWGIGRFPAETPG